MQGEAFIGDATNYTKITTDGEITLAGTARVEMENAFSLDGIGKGATAPTLVRLGNTMGYQFGIGDDGYMSFEIPLNWDTTTDISIKLHVYVNEDYDITAGEMRWQGTWSAVPETGAEAVDGATHTGTLDSGDVNISTTTKGLTEVKMGAIAAASLALHDTVFILVSRIAINAGTEVTEEPVVVHAEYEWIANKLGEAT